MTACHRAEVNTTGQDLVPNAEERSNYGKVVKQSIRGMWGLEYEIEDIQVSSSQIHFYIGFTYETFHSAVSFVNYTKVYG